MSANNDTSLLSRREAAELLTVSTRTVARLEDRGKLTPIRLSSRTIRYARKDVLALLETDPVG